MTEQLDAQNAEVLAAIVTAETIRTDAAGQIITLLASIDTLNLMLAKTNTNITSADVKSVARETRQLVRQVIRLTRLVARVLDSTGTGPVGP